MSLLDIIRQAGRDAVESAQPVAVAFGVVTKTSPLTVLIDGRPLMSWEKAVLDQLAASGGGQLVAIVESTAPARRPTT